MKSMYNRKQIILGMFIVVSLLTVIVATFHGFSYRILCLKQCYLNLDDDKCLESSQPLGEYLKIGRYDFTNIELTGDLEFVVFSRKKGFEYVGNDSTLTEIEALSQIFLVGDTEGKSQLTLSDATGQSFQVKIIRNGNLANISISKVKM